MKRIQVVRQRVQCHDGNESSDSDSIRSLSQTASYKQYIDSPPDGRPFFNVSCLYISPLLQVALASNLCANTKMREIVGVYFEELPCPFAVEQTPKK